MLGVELRNPGHGTGAIRYLPRARRSPPRRSSTRLSSCHGVPLQFLGWPREVLTGTSVAARRAVLSPSPLPSRLIADRNRARRAVQAEARSLPAEEIDDERRHYTCRRAVRHALP